MKIATEEVIKTYSGASEVAVAPNGKVWVLDYKEKFIKIYDEENI